jgi:hypothetical protein
MCQAERERVLYYNLLVRIHFIMVMIGWTGLAPWEFEFPFPGSLTSTLLTQNGVEWHLSARRMIDHITAQHPHRTPKYA